MTALESIKQDLKETEEVIRSLESRNLLPEEVSKWKELRERLKSQYIQYIGAHNGSLCSTNK